MALGLFLAGVTFAIVFVVVLFIAGAALPVTRVMDARQK